MVWTSLFAGHGVILCFYSQEWYARQHCPLKNVSPPAGRGGRGMFPSQGCDGLRAVLRRRVAEPMLAECSGEGNSEWKG